MHFGHYVIMAVICYPTWLYSAQANTLERDMAMWAGGYDTETTLDTSEVEVEMPVDESTSVLQPDFIPESQDCLWTNGIGPYIASNATVGAVVFLHLLFYESVKSSLNCPLKGPYITSNCNPLLLFLTYIPGLFSPVADVLALLTLANRESQVAMVWEHHQGCMYFLLFSIMLIKGLLAIGMPSVEFHAAMVSMDDAFRIIAFHSVMLLFLQSIFNIIYWRDLWLWLH